MLEFIHYTQLEEVSDKENVKASDIRKIPRDEDLTDNNETGDVVVSIPGPQWCSKASGITQWDIWPSNRHGREWRYWYHCYW